MAPSGRDAGVLAGPGSALALGVFAKIFASGPTDLQQTLTLLWVMIGLSVAGSIITFGFLIYALWKFRDPRAKGRRYG